MARAGQTEGEEGGEGGTSLKLKLIGHSAGSAQGRDGRWCTRKGQAGSASVRQWELLLPPGARDWVAHLGIV